MFKAACCCDLIRSPVSLCTAVLLFGEQNLFICICCKNPLRLSNVLNTPAGLDLFTSSWAADTCQTHKEEADLAMWQKYCTDVDLIWVSGSSSSSSNLRLPSVTDTCSVVKTESRNVSDQNEWQWQAPGAGLRFPTEHVDVSDLTNW